MSVRTGPAFNDFLYRGTYTTAPGGGFPGETMPALPELTLCGLAFHNGSYTGGYETLFGCSKRFTGGQFIFFGKSGNGQLGFRTNDAGAETLFGLPATDTWFQWALTLDSASGLMTGYWKLLGDVAWTHTDTNVDGATWVPDTFRLGTDEYDSSAGNWTIDNVRCWERILTGAELLAEVASTTVVDSADLFEWWKLRADGILVGSVHAHDLHNSNAAAADTDSPLEAPADSTGATAVGFAVTGRWSGGGLSGAPAHAVGSAALPRWKGTGSSAAPSSGAGAGTVGRWTGAGHGASGALGTGAGAVGRWTGAGLGASGARASGSAPTGRWLGSGISRHGGSIANGAGVVPRWAGGGFSRAGASATGAAIVRGWIGITAPEDEMAPPLNPLYPDTDILPLLADGSSRYRKLKTDEERRDQIVLAELLLGLRAPVYIEDDASKIQYAVALQVMYQLDQGTILAQFMKSQSNAHPGNMSTYRDRFIHPGAQMIIARVTKTANVGFSPFAPGM